MDVDSRQSHSGMTARVAVVMILKLAHICRKLPMTRFSRRGATTTQVALLVLFVGLLVAYFYFKGSYGVIGHVVEFPTSTSDQIVFVRQDGGRTNLFLVKADG